MTLKSEKNIINKILEAIPPGIAGFSQEAKDQFKHSMKKLFQEMDLVTREEFEVQRKVLAKTREIVDQLQAKLENDNE